jgi:hypothetical protein
VIGKLVALPKKVKKGEVPYLCFTKSEVDKYFKEVQRKNEIDLDEIIIQKPKVKRQKID